MLNQVILVGRLARNPEVQELENGKKVANITLAVPRSFKNHEGEYETDFIDCTLWNGVAENASLYCEQGDIIGVKGRLQKDSYEKDGENRTRMNVVAEKVTFLSSKSHEKTNVERDDR